MTYIFEWTIDTEFKLRDEQRHYYNLARKTLSLSHTIQEILAYQRECDNRRVRTTNTLLLSLLDRNTYA